MAHTVPRLLCHLLLLATFSLTVLASPEGDILLKFRESLKYNGGPLSTWDPNVPPCVNTTYRPNWVDVICEGGFVYGLQIENLGLSGTLDFDTLKALPNFRTISVMNNAFEGPLPVLSKLPGLKSAYFSKNKFSGALDNSVFHGMHWLKKLHLANNQFTGKIPSVLGDLPRLMELNLRNNQFEGSIPEFHQPRTVDVVVSNNNLEGPIPPSLSRLKVSSFEGNDGLCDAPLSNSCNDSPKLAGWTIALVVVAVTVAICAIIATAIILMRKKKPQPEEGSSVAPSTHRKAPSTDLDKMEQGHASPDRSTNGKKAEHGQKLLFLKDETERFDLPDLLRASAEILGSGVFGSTYKAALTTGPVMVVKRFRQMNNVGKEDFHEHMRRLGRLSHKNLLPVVAFYYRKEEKLLVSEYVNNVSLAVHLHGNKTQGNQSLDWPTRLKIVKGVAKGIVYLYNELPSLTAPHGHLKSSNVLLTESFDAVLTDYALLPVVNLEHAQDHMIAYKSPEFKHSGRITKKTDVWTLGILILEVLTGKFPSNFLQQAKGSESDLATWVHSVLDEDANADVFDKDMTGTKNCEGEIMKLLKIALSCCEVDVEKRWDIKEAMERIEDVKERDGDDDFYSSYASEADVRSSRGLSEDFSHVSLNI